MTCPLFSVKDALLLALVVLLVLSLREIARLKKIIASRKPQEVLPRLLLDLVLVRGSASNGLYLENDSLFLARDVVICDTAATLTDYGFRKTIQLVFTPVEFLKPKQRVQLGFKVIDSGREILADEKEKILPHLLAAEMTVKVEYSNIEDARFRSSFELKKEHFHSSGVESIPR